jgi:hypothetical protein
MVSLSFDSRVDAAGVVRCDRVEPLPEGFEGFWIASPASIVHLLAKSWSGRSGAGSD